MEHHLTAEYELHRLAQLARRCGSECTLRPWIQLAAEARAEKLCDDADILLRQTEHLRQDTPEVDDSLRGLVQRQSRAIPDRGGRVQFKRVVRLGRRDVSLVEPDWRVCECIRGVTALTLQSLARAVCRENHVRVIVCFQESLDIRL